MYISIIRSGGSRNFKNGGGELQCVIEFLGFEKCFDTPQHFFVVVRVENKLHMGGEGPESAFDKHNFVVKNHKFIRYISYSAM